jgi:CheY-like chemotaxis protein/anti-sigma regulatory factor (Ser/Thr protein kinase)
MQEFIAMLAHELRNPLAPIRNAVSLMKKEGLPEESRRHANNVIDRQLGYLTHLVDDLLDVGRIATGKIWLRDEMIDFRQVVTFSLESVRDAIESRGHELVVELPQEAIPLRGDATRLTQALLNLLTNAAKYTPEHGRIVLSVVLEEGIVVASVTDNGRGIAPEAQERIFDLFTQERPATGMNDPGLGIGLALARVLIEQHGGQLTVESAGTGRGSTFRIRLPLADAAATLQARGPAAATQAAPEADAALRVLVVDDNRDAADMLASLLAALGHESRPAYGAAEALEAARSFAPDVVFLDLNMPDGDGISLLPQLRAIFGESVHVAALTGYGQQHDRDTTRAAGFQEHLTKPVDIARLEATLADRRRRPSLTMSPLPLAGEGRGEGLATVSPRSRSPPVQRLSPLPLTEIDMPTRRLLLTLLAAAATSACTALPGPRHRQPGRPAGRRPQPRRRAHHLAPPRHELGRRPARATATRSRQQPHRRPGAGGAVGRRRQRRQRRDRLDRADRLRARDPGARPRSPAGARAGRRRLRSTSPPCPIPKPRAPAGPTTSA